MTYVCCENSFVILHFLHVAFNSFEYISGCQEVPFGPGFVVRFFFIVLQIPRQKLILKAFFRYRLAKM